MAMIRIVGNIIEYDSHKFVRHMFYNGLSFTGDLHYCEHCNNTVSLNGLHCLNCKLLAYSCCICININNKYYYNNESCAEIVLRNNNYILENILE